MTKMKTMDLRHFEQLILRLAFETKTRITAASVAYYLGIPSKEANQLLNQLLQQGVLELDSDGDGNLFYKVPHRTEITAALDYNVHLPDDLSHQIEQASVAEQETVASGQAGSSVLGQISMVSPDSADETPPFNPAVHVPDHLRAKRAADGGTQPQPARRSPVLGSSSEAPLRHPVLAPGFAEEVSASQLEAVRHASVRRSEPARSTSHQGFDGAARTMEPDAWVGNCGVSDVIVQAEVRCEPQPLGTQRPTLVSCTNPDEEREIQRQYTPKESRSPQRWWTGEEARPHTEMVWSGPTEPVRPHVGQGAMVLASTHPSHLPMQYHLEEPEHQPGMALLLSLILCGTGQIYNKEVSKGILMMVLCFLLWFALLGWVVHIWSIVDAVVVAEKINRKKEQRI